jgi:hypothetical protein
MADRRLGSNSPTRICFMENVASDSSHGRSCYCPKDGVHPTYLRRAGIPPGYCGRCLVCHAPGHTCHFPGSLPFTGAWCDAHYAIIADCWSAAEDLSQPYGVRDVGRKCFRVPGRRRLVLWRRNSLVLEFRSECLARWVEIAPSGSVGRRQARWDHPLIPWTLPLELMRRPDWCEASQDEFEAAWASAPVSTGPR